MSTATITRTTTNRPKNKANATYRVPGQSLAALAADTEQPESDIRTWLRSKDFEIVNWQNAELVSGEAAIAICQHFYPILQKQRMTKMGLVLVAEPAPIAATNGKEPVPAPAPLRLKTFEVSEIHAETLTNALTAQFDSPTERLEMLEAIQGKTDLGRALSAAIVGRYAKAKQAGARLSFASPQTIKKVRAAIAPTE